MIEPDRSFPGVDTLRALARKDLDEAFLTAMVSPMIYELGRRHIVHPNTLIAYNRMIALKNAQESATIRKKEE